MDCAKSSPLSPLSPLSLLSSVDPQPSKSTECLSRVGALEDDEVRKPIRDALEIELAEMEMRLRKFHQELVQPTIHKTTLVENGFRQIQVDVQRNSSMVFELSKQGAKIDNQLALVDNFREEMTQWDAERHLKQIEVAESLADARNELDTFRFTLDRKDAEINSLQRTMERMTCQFSKLQETTDEFWQKVEERLSQLTKQMNTTKTEVEVKMTSLETRHNRLSDELWEDKTNLAKLNEAYTSTHSLTASLGEEVIRLQHDKASVMQLEIIQETMNDLMHDSNSKTNRLKHTVDNMVDEVKCHFETATNTVAAHNATMLEQVRTAYDEVGATAHLRGNTNSKMEETHQRISNLEKTLSTSQGQTEKMIKKLQLDIEGIQKFRKHEENIINYGERSLKEAVVGIHNSSDNVMKRVEHLSNIVCTILQSERMACALEQQDTADRAKVALMGFRDTKDEKIGGSQSRPASTNSGVRARSRVAGSSSPTPDVPVISVDNRCLSCCGQSQNVISAFKMACLQYAPGTVSFRKKSYTRSELLDLRSTLLEEALECVANGPIRSSFHGWTDSADMEKSSGFSSGRTFPKSRHLAPLGPPAIHLR